MGSQVLHQLANRGIEATGFERFQPGHERGAAGGETRIFRVAYKEGGQYVPMLREARGAWESLSVECGSRLIDPCGALTIGLAQDADVRTVLEVDRQWGLGVEQIDHHEAARRFPQHRLFEDDVMLLDRQGGLLYPQLAVREVTALAERAGAKVIQEATVVDITESATGVAVHYLQGETTRIENFDQVIVCTGPWITRSVPKLAEQIEIRRAVLCWFAPHHERDWRPSAFPVGIRRSGGENTFSFFPTVGDGVKINLHAQKSVVDDPDALDRKVAAEYVGRVSAAVSRCLPGLPAQPTLVRSFMEGYTADNHGVIGRDPERPSVLVMGGFSGHGFKLAPVFARAAVDLLFSDQTDVPIDHLALSRLSAGI